VENIWDEPKISMAWYLFGRRAEERGACRLVDTALSFKSFRAILGGVFFVQTVLLSEHCSTRFER
jgi:hypothetical protein